MEEEGVNVGEPAEDLEEEEEGGNVGETEEDLEEDEKVDEEDMDEVFRFVGDAAEKNGNEDDTLDLFLFFFTF